MTKEQLPILRAVIFSSLKDKYFTMSDVYNIIDLIKQHFGINISREYIKDYIDNFYENGILHFEEISGNNFAFHFDQEWIASLNPSENFNLLKENSSKRG